MLRLDADLAASPRLVEHVPVRQVVEAKLVIAGVENTLIFADQQNVLIEQILRKVRNSTF